MLVGMLRLREELNTKLDREEGQAWELCTLKIG